MSKEENAVELKDEELEKVSGGFSPWGGYQEEAPNQSTCPYYNSATGECNYLNNCPHPTCIDYRKKKDSKNNPIEHS